MNQHSDKNAIDAEVLFRCSRDLMDSVERQSKATEKVNESLKGLNFRIDNLEKAFIESSNSSGRVTKALNWLTGALVIIGLAQVVVAFLEYSK